MDYSNMDDCEYNLKAILWLFYSNSGRSIFKDEISKSQCPGITQLTEHRGLPRPRYY